MSKIHRDKDYLALSGLLHSKFMGWSNRKWSVYIDAEIKDLQELSLQAFKMAKFLEKQLQPKAKNLELFNCNNNIHDVKVWKEVGSRASDRKPVMRGECSECLAEITDYGK